jgi:hypothetical protein
MSNNLELWDKVERTDPSQTKKAKVQGVQITAISPQYQIKNATEQFGPYAIKWGFKNIEFDFSLMDSLKLIVFKGTFFCPDGECQIVNSAKAYMDRAETMVDADFAKKMETDALTKVLSKMGFNADVFMGKFEDSLYLETALNTAALENADNKVEEQARQEEEYKKWTEDHLATISTAATMNELETVFKMCVRKAKLRQDEVAVVKFNNAKNTRKGELSNGYASRDIGAA